MPPITVTPVTATGATFEASAHLFNEYRQFYSHAADLVLARQFLQDRLLRGESLLLLASVGEQPAGIAQLYRGFSSLRCRQTAILNDLYVAPAHRCKGVGHHLVEASILKARQLGAASLYLETAQQNTRAQALYERLGFRQCNDFQAYALELTESAPGVIA